MYEAPADISTNRVSNRHRFSPQRKSQGRCLQELWDLGYTPTLIPSELTFSSWYSEEEAKAWILVFCILTDKPATDAPTMAHAALRDLVERAVEEAKKLPGLGGSDAGRSGDQDPSDISEQTYEDLLATAILNKVSNEFWVSDHVVGWRDDVADRKKLC